MMRKLIPSFIIIVSVISYFPCKAFNRRELDMTGGRETTQARRKGCGHPLGATAPVASGPFQILETPSND